jgi:hypothetical protein
MKVRKELLWRKYHMQKGDPTAALLLHIEEDRDDQSIDDDAYAQGQVRRCECSAVHVKIHSHPLYFLILSRPSGTLLAHMH